MIKTYSEIYILLKNKKSIDNLYLTKNFLWKEVLVNQTELPSLIVLQNLFKITTVLQKYRDTIFKNRTIKITSGWRSINYNLKIGGAKKSKHIEGKALDFIVEDLTPKQVQKLLDPIFLGQLEYAPSWSHISKGPLLRFDDKNRVYKVGEYFNK